MARDYKDRPTPKRKHSRQGAPRWAFALAGFGLGLCVALGAYIEGRYPGTIIAGTDLEPVPGADTDAASVAATGVRAPRPKYTFYDLLPEMEVNVPAREPDQKLHGPQPPKPAARLSDAQRAARILSGADIGVASRMKPVPKVVAPKPASSETKLAPVIASSRLPFGAYMVQVGSFRQMSDADRLKAALAMNGHRAIIQTTRMSDNSQRHRVRLGPFRSKESAKKISVSPGRCGSACDGL